MEVKQKTKEERRADIKALIGDAVVSEGKRGLAHTFTAEELAGAVISIGGKEVGKLSMKPLTSYKGKDSKVYHMFANDRQFAGVIGSVDGLDILAGFKVAVRE